MIEVQLTQSTLLKILYEGQSFTDSLSHTLQSVDLSGPQLAIVRSLTSCTLHHYRVLHHHVERFFPSLTIEQKLTVMIVIGNTIFIKRIHEQTIFTYLTNFLLHLQIDKTAIETFIEASKAGQPLINPAIKVNSPNYLELKYNTPLWVIKMWIKHFGFSTTLKILIANSKPVVQACRVNTFKTTVQDVLHQSNGFLAGPIQNTVLYEGKSPLKKQAAFTDHLIFTQRFAITDVMNQINFENVHGQVLLVETRPQALYLEIPMVTNGRLTLNVATNSIERKRAMQKALVEFSIPNVHIIESPPHQLIAHISQQQDMVLVVPQCSKFDLIRSLPDFFVHFHQDDLDALIREQMETLIASSAFVEAGGLLFYGVNTLNQKEGSWLINEFIKANPGFQLVFEKQFFPHEKWNTALYVAALRKRTCHDA
jgi:16S rRNA C967 or C1407 C5-methylase (RsmB/RsmF family)